MNEVMLRLLMKENIIPPQRPQYSSTIRCYFHLNFQVLLLLSLLIRCDCLPFARWRAELLGTKTLATLMFKTFERATCFMMCLSDMLHPPWTFNLMQTFLRLNCCPISTRVQIEFVESVFVDNNYTANIGDELLDGRTLKF